MSEGRVVVIVYLDVVVVSDCKTCYILPRDRSQLDHPYSIQQPEEPRQYNRKGMKPATCKIPVAYPTWWLQGMGYTVQGQEQRRDHGKSGIRKVMTNIRSGSNRNMTNGNRKGKWNTGNRTGVGAGTEQESGTGTRAGTGTA